jgi:hypothetical protein
MSPFGGVGIHSDPATGNGIRTFSNGNVHGDVLQREKIDDFLPKKKGERKNMVS